MDLIQKKAIVEYKTIILKKTSCIDKNLQIELFTCQCEVGTLGIQVTKVGLQLNPIARNKLAIGNVLNNISQGLKILYKWLNSKYFWLYEHSFCSNCFIEYKRSHPY